MSAAADTPPAEPTAQLSALSGERVTLEMRILELRRTIDELERQLSTATVRYRSVVNQIAAVVVA